jgi:hypothetical protein
LAPLSSPRHTHLVANLDARHKAHDRLERVLQQCLVALDAKDLLDHIQAARLERNAEALAELALGNAARKHLLDDASQTCIGRGCGAAGALQDVRIDGLGCSGAGTYERGPRLAEGKGRHAQMTVSVYSSFFSMSNRLSAPRAKERASSNSPRFQYTLDATSAARLRAGKEASSYRISLRAGASAP